MAARDHLRAGAAAPIGHQCRLEAFGQRIHPLARIGLARDFQHHLRADAQAHPGDLRQVDALDQQVRAPFLPRDGVADLGHRRFPVTTLDQRHLALIGLALHRAAEITGDAAFERDVDRLDHLHRCLGTRVARDPKKAADLGHPSLAIAVAVSTMRFEKPHSLSYQLTTRTSLPSITAVSRLSTVDE